MHLKIFICCMASLFLFSFCGSDGGRSNNVGKAEQATGTGNGEDGDGQTTSEEEITKFFIDQTFVSWFGHSEVQTPQSSSSPHGDMKTFINPALQESMNDFDESHPVGSIAAKELYLSNSSEVSGYLYAEKISEGTAANTWLWYEDLNLSEDNGVEVYGRGVANCSGCHGDEGLGPQDYILIDFNE